MRAPLASIFVIVVGTALSIEAPRADDGLGRLFWTPAERAILDRTRENTPLPVKESASNESPSSMQFQKQVTVKGIVIRNDGRHAVWINDSSTVRDNAGHSVFGVTSRAVDTDHITVRVGEHGHPVKPGQVLFLDSGRVAEGYSVQPLPSISPTTSAGTPVEAVEAVEHAETPAVLYGTPEVTQRTPLPVSDAMSREWPR